MSTDTSELGLERRIAQILTGEDCKPPLEGTVGEPPGPWDVEGRGGVGWIPGNWHDYDRDYCVDLVQLRTFLKVTQPEVAEGLSLDGDTPTRRKFLSRLQGEISSRGVIDVLRSGVKHNQHHLELFYGTPSEGNPAAQERFTLNRFSVTRQLRFSGDETQQSIDLCLFLNGLPAFTVELKNSLTKQTMADAVEQYRQRNHREKLFEFGRCVAHFAVDEHEVAFCTRLEGAKSWFLPFNRGWNDGAGNPPMEHGLKTDYLWREVLERRSVTNILEKFAQITERKDEKTKKKRRTQIWPRYHQLRVVRRLLADAGDHGAGRRYLIQHSAGSGKSNSIAWLAHQLIGLEKEGKPVFDSVVVVTDRRILDRQIRDTIKQYAQVSALVGHAEHSGDLRRFLEQGKKIIVSTVQKFPFIVNEIGDEQRGRRFAIVIDEAHSSQGGKTSASMSTALSEEGQVGEDETFEDQINRAMESRKLLSNASYFAFTATPKNKTLEIFGEPEPQPDGSVQHRAFDTYSMKQAIEEGFILDVLKHYTPIQSYYRLAKAVDDDPEFDVKKARAKLRRFVEGNKHAIRLKAEIMVDHFHEQVIAQQKIGGQARALVVTNGIERAIDYWQAIQKYLKERKSPYRAIVAFSGDQQRDGETVNEASLNHFPSSQIATKFQEEPYRFLVCADKFQTGYDEPLLHTMYVDKTLSGIKAVQTLSRLNRAHPKKHDVFVLDFLNEMETIRDSFAQFYRATILSDETDPNKLHDLQHDLDQAQVYSESDVEEFARRYLDGAPRDELDPILDGCVACYLTDLEEDGQVEFKGKAKAFTRTYAFLSAVLPYTSAEWEKRSILLNFLVSKLPSPKEDDLSKGILDAIDMDSYRLEKHAMLQLTLPDEDAQIAPVPVGLVGGKPEPEMDRLSKIIERFNDLFGDIEWGDEDKVREVLTQELPRMVAADEAYQNAVRNSDKQNARLEHDRALERAIVSILKDHTQIFKQFQDNPGFKQWLTETVFDSTYDPDIRKLDDAVSKIELALRDLIETSLEGDVEQLPDHVVLNARQRWEAKAKKDPTVKVPAAPAMAELLEWFDLRELEAVIVNKSCWKRFQEKIQNKATFQTRFGHLAELRNTFAHNRTLDDVTRHEGKAAVMWFEKLLAA